MPTVICATCLGRGGPRCQACDIPVHASACRVCEEVRFFAGPCGHCHAAYVTSWVDLDADIELDCAACIEASRAPPCTTCNGRGVVPMVRTAQQ